MALYEDMQRALVSVVRPREERKETPDLHFEIREMRAQIAALQRALAMLAEIVAQGDGIDPNQLRTRVLEAARVPMDEEPMESEVDEHAVIETAYRGTTPGTGPDRCSRCRAPLAADDPEMRDEGGARICVACYGRR